MLIISPFAAVFFAYLYYKDNKKLEKLLVIMRAKQGIYGDLRDVNAEYNKIISEYEHSPLPPPPVEDVSEASATNNITEHVVQETAAVTKKSKSSNKKMVFWALYLIVGALIAGVLIDQLITDPGSSPTSTQQQTYSNQVAEKSDDQIWLDYTISQNGKMYTHLLNVESAYKRSDYGTLAIVGKKLGDVADDSFKTSNNMTVSGKLTTAKKHYEEPMAYYTAVGYYAELAGKDKNPLAMNEADEYASKAVIEFNQYKKLTNT